MAFTLKVRCSKCSNESEVPAELDALGNLIARTGDCVHCGGQLADGGAFQVLGIKSDAAEKMEPSPLPEPSKAPEPTPAPGEPPPSPPEKPGYGPSQSEAKHKQLLQQLASPNPDPVFTARLKSILKDNKFDRRIPNRKRGKLDMKRLYRAATGKENLFMQKEERKNKEYHVKLLVDISGSMSGHKLEIAAQTADFLGKSLSKAGVKFSVDTFNGFYHSVLKENEPIKDITKGIFEAFNNGPTNAQGSNHDFAAVKKALQELQPKKYGKILVVFSDGQPASSFRQYYLDGENKDFEALYNKEIRELAKLGKRDEISKIIDLQDNPESIRKEILSAKGVQTLGVGIEDSYVERIYPNRIIVEDLARFKDQVIEALKPLIRRT